MWLALWGLFGLVSYAVSQRTAEIGLRMAIGATERQVQWMVLRQAMAPGLSRIEPTLALRAQ